jgi:hypothetical protein
MQLLQIIAEGAGRLQQDFPSMSPMQTEATGSAIRLLYTAISNQAALADAIRAVNSDLMVVTVESILFSPVPHPQQQPPHKYGSNYMSLLFQYISEVRKSELKLHFINPSKQSLSVSLSGMIN